MSSHVWCHGPNCHTEKTKDRVRGPKDARVLRTRKVKQWGNSSLYEWFCSNGCYNDFAHKHVEQIVRIAPRNTPLETPVKIEKVTEKDYFGRDYIRTVILDLTKVSE